MKKPMSKWMVRASGVLLVAMALAASETKNWTQSESADFEKGVLQKLSLRSDGLLTLAPRSNEVFDTSAAYLWALARDSKGALYAGGAGAKLFRIPPGGAGKLVAELDALEIHAIAVDARDRVYVATAPDGKVYRTTDNGKPEVFYDPKAKYIWALAFDHQGNLLVATGDHGELHRVTPDGKGTVFFQTGQTHVRSMAVDAADNVIVGTDPGGLVLRVTPAGEGFVLYQLAKKEVTAVAVARDGAIYAAAAGNKQAAAPAAPAPILTSPSPAGGFTVTVGQAGAPAVARPPAPPPAAPGTPAVPGGSEVYRIEADGYSHRVWNHAQDVVYAIAFDATGRLLLGTGNKGGVYRVESPVLSTALVTLPVTQVTAFQSAPDGRLYAASGNTGKLYEIGPELEKEGSIESDVFDAGMYTTWGRLTFEAHLNGGHIAVTARSGNLDQPQKNWSPWSAAITATTGARIASPAARFVQWRATLTGDGGRQSPELESVDVAYLPKNVEPRVDQIEITPANYKFPAPSSSPLLAIVASPQTLNLPTLGRRSTVTVPTPPSENTTTTPAMQLAKGYLGARWLAIDPNGDTMIYRVEIRGAAEKEWKLLKDKVAEKYLSWDSTAFPDGEYRLRVTASDGPSNPPAEALAGQMESDPFWIDNTPPKITGLTAARTSGKLVVKWHAADALNDLSKAEYSLDGGEWAVAAPVGQLSDSLELDYALSLDAPPGEHTIAVRVSDANDNMAVEKVVIR